MYIFVIMTENDRNKWGEAEHTQASVQWVAEEDIVASLRSTAQMLIAMANVEEMRADHKKKISDEANPKLPF